MCFSTIQAFENSVDLRVCPNPNANLRVTRVFGSVRMAQFVLKIARNVKGTSLRSPSPIMASDVTYRRPTKSLFLFYFYAGLIAGCVCVYRTFRYYVVELQLHCVNWPTVTLLSFCIVVFYYPRPSSQLAVETTCSCLSETFSRS